MDLKEFTDLSNLILNILVPYFFFRSKYLLYLLLLIILVAVSLSFISYIINNNTTFKFREDKSLYSGIIISTPIILTTTTLKLFQRLGGDKNTVEGLNILIVIDDSCEIFTS